jgi:hypothetical protein
LTKPRRGGLARRGGGDHVGIEVERQIVRWMRDALGYPDEATGLFLTGSSMANFLAIIVAKTSAIGDDTRQLGLQRAGRELVAYTSTEGDRGNREHGSRRPAERNFRNCLS